MTVSALHQRMNKRFTRLGRRIDARFKAIDARFKAVDARFDGVDARFDGVDARFDALDAQFRRLFRTVESLGEKLHKDTRSLDERVEVCLSVAHEHEERLKDLAPRPPL